MPDLNYETLQRLSQQSFRMDWPAGLRYVTGLNTDSNAIGKLLTGGGELANAFPAITRLLGSHSLQLDGSSGCWATTPDAVAVDITGNLDLRWEGVGVGGGITQALVSKFNTTGNQRSYLLATTFGLPVGTVSTDGIAASASGLFTPTISFAAYRMTVVAATGVITIFNATNMDGTWVQIGQTDTAATGIFNSTSVLGIGASGASGAVDRFTGNVTRIELRNGIDGTVVANPDFRNLAPGTTSFADGAGLTWTLNGTAEII